jgi:hypothetical protein
VNGTEVTLGREMGLGAAGLGAFCRRFGVLAIGFAFFEVGVVVMPSWADDGSLHR